MTGIVDRLRAPRRGWLWVLALSGAAGFHVGFVGFPTWQVAVETAQVVAGIVRYPPGNPFYVYHTKLWTVLHQLLALLLRAGASEIGLSKIVSGVLGAVSFQALAVFVWALSGDALIALGAPFLIFFARAAEHGAEYPISLLGTDHTYGVIGLSSCVLTMALAGAGCTRSAPFLLGVEPAVHPSIGAWLWIVFAAAILSGVDLVRREFRGAGKYFAAGCAVTAVSLAVQMLFIYDAPQVDRAIGARYLAGFVNAWDLHRRPARLWTVGVILNLCALALSTLWIKRRSADMMPPAVFLLRLVAASAALSLLLVFITWLPPNRVPTALLVLMPGRLLNVDTFAFVALVLGLLGAYPARWWSGALMGALVIGLFVSYRSMVWDGVRIDGSALRHIQLNPLYVFEGVTVGLVAAGGFSRGKTSTIALPIALAGRAAAGVVLTLAAVLTWRLSQPTDFRDRTNDPLFAAAAAERNGLIATGGSFHLVQLYTRRPVLLDGGALDSLPYALETGPEMERILRDVYGIDFFNPPPEARGGGAIPPRTNRPVWERYRREKWLEIGRTFNVTQVLTRSDWRLDLPIAVDSRGLRLYRIPR